MSIGSVTISIVFLLMLVSPYLIFKLVVMATEKKSDRVSTGKPLDTPARFDLLPNHPSPLNLGKTVLRFLVLVLSFIVFGGCLLLLVLFFPGFVVVPTKGLAATLMLLVWVYAFTVYMAMGIGWVANRRIARFWPLSGTATGILSLVVLPTYFFIVSPNSQGYSVGYSVITNMISPLIAETIFLLPNILFAVVLVRFHLLPAEDSR